MTDYAVYFQEFNPNTKVWEYKQEIFNCESNAKLFAATILKAHPENDIIIKSKEYMLLNENGNSVKKYLGKETFIVKSTPESHNQFLRELDQNTI